MTGGAGFSESENHGSAPQSQHRVQTPGCPGVHQRRDPAWAGTRDDLSRNLIRIRVRKFEQGAFDDDAQAADLMQQYEARIAALERLVGKQALELEFLKGALKNGPRPRNGTTSAITGLAVSPLPKDAG